MKKHLGECRLWLVIVLIGIIIIGGCTTSTSTTISSATGSIQKSGTANAPIVNVLAEPEYSIDVISKLDNGVVVSVIGRNTDAKFVLISLNGDKGWISIYDIVSEQDLTLLPVVSYKGSTWVSTLISSASGIIKRGGTANPPIVKVYANPIPSLDIIANIKNGVVVTAIGKSSNSKYILISLSGEKGWISKYDIVFEQDPFFLTVVSYSGTAWSGYESSGYSSESSTSSGKSSSSTGCPDGCTYHKEGCDIKGNISYDTGEKIYHLPWQEFYGETVINSDFGEYWFCTEDEARQNGWRRSQQ